MGTHGSVTLNFGPRNSSKKGKIIRPRRGSDMIHWEVQNTYNSSLIIINSVGYNPTIRLRKKITQI